MRGAGTNILSAGEIPPERLQEVAISLKEIVQHDPEICALLGVSLTFDMVQFALQSAKDRLTDVVPLFSQEDNEALINFLPIIMALNKLLEEFSIDTITLPLEIAQGLLSWLQGQGNVASEIQWILSLSSDGRSTLSN